MHDLNHRINRSCEAAEVNDDIPTTTSRGLDYGRRPCVVSTIVTVGLATLETQEVDVIHHQNVRSAAGEINPYRLAWTCRDSVMKEVHEFPRSSTTGASMIVPPADGMARLRMRTITSDACFRNRVQITTRTSPTMRLITVITITTTNLCSDFDGSLNSKEIREPIPTEENAIPRFKQVAAPDCPSR